MEQINSTAEPSFFGRLGLALRLVFNRELAGKVAAGLRALEQKPTALPPERVHASGLVLLSALQREGRLLDFLQQEIASFSDEEVGSAARVVHGGCRKVLNQYFDFEPSNTQAEGTSVTVPQGFDPQRIRLTGNLSGQPPFRGTLKHHGWVAKAIRMPVVSDAMDARVIAPAEIEVA